MSSLGEDVLSFTDMNGITGSWDAETGTLTLTGLATKEQYQAALRTIGYENVSESPTAGEKTITFTITDQNSRNVGDPAGALDAQDSLTINISKAPPGPEEGEGHYYEEPVRGEDIGLLGIPRPEAIPLPGGNMGPIPYPGDVLDTGGLFDFIRFRSPGAEDPCGTAELYPYCTVEEALQGHLGCRVAPALDPEARICNVRWDFLEGLGWEAPLLSEEQDMYSRLFLRSYGDPGFNVASGEFADSFGGTDHEAPYVPTVMRDMGITDDPFSDTEKTFNDMKPKELKEAFFRGREQWDVRSFKRA